MQWTLVRRAGLIICALTLVACSGAYGQRSALSAVMPRSGPAVTRQGANSRAPSLLTVDSRTHQLEAWPIRRGGGSDPEPISGPLAVTGVGAMATIGDVVAIANQFPSRLVLYNTKNQTTRTIDDPFGTPIGIAVAKDATVYLLNVTKSASPVTMYAPPAHRPVELNCRPMDHGQAIAVDDEGDVFIQGYPKNGNGFVAEIPNGPNGPEPQNCSILQLEANAGYVGGIAVDPKTDDLITLDDPSFCAGGEEGRMTIYPKPYSQTTGRSRDIGMNCTGGLWLNADSTIVFTSDEDVSGSFSFILQRSFPDGGDMGIYHARNFTSVAPMPSTLPD